MLEKDPGSPKITQLCIILIVEGDMNAIMKLIWNRRLVPVAGKTGLISPVQFGNRKGRAILNNDATACYDHMTPEVSSLHLQSRGLPETADKYSVLLNHNMHHHIKTKAGITKDHYKHEPGSKIYGEGQGKTSSPSNWLFQISTLLGTLHKMVIGIQRLSVCKKNIEKRVAEAFVDDTNCTYVDQDDQ
eukprot:2382927-Ditylum_brightwellii.AAC.1